MAIKPKYRLLRDDELKSLEKEFIEFLIVHGVDGDLWEKMNQQDEKKAKDLVVLFSNVVFDKIVENDAHVVYISPKMIHSVKVSENVMVGVWMKTKSNEVDCRLFLENHSFLQKYAEHIEMFQGTKGCQSKAHEIVSLLDTGYSIDKGGSIHAQLLSSIKKASKKASFL